MSPLTQDRQKLVDRITKLMALADSTTHTAEAESARNMAMELMAKHNISISQQQAEDYKVLKEDSGRQTKAQHEVVLLNAIANINGVAMVNGTGYYKFIGKPSDIEAFNYMRDIVYSQRNAAWKSYYPSRWSKHPGPSELAKWKMGFAYGVADKIRSLMDACESKQQEWGLVPVTPHKTAASWYQSQNKVTQGRASSSSFNRDGFTSGQSVSLNKGVTAARGPQARTA